MGRVAVLQMCSSDDVKENLTWIHHEVVKAANQDVELLVLPENFASMGASTNKPWQHAEYFGDGHIQESLSHMARGESIWIVAGSIPIKTGDENNRYRSSSLVFDDRGVCVARYDKIHLFDVALSDREYYKESDNYEPGDKVVVIDTPVGRLGLSVCYDLRFVELFLAMRAQGAEIFSIPSAFTQTTGRSHWSVLLQARAIENLCYVLAPNQAGRHVDGRSTHGHSMIVSPWGELCAMKKTELGLVEADIDLDYLKRLRLQFPCYQHHVLSRGFYENND